MGSSRLTTECKSNQTHHRIQNNHKTTGFKDPGPSCRKHAPVSDVILKNQVKYLGKWSVNWTSEETSGVQTPAAVRVSGPVCSGAASTSDLWPLLQQLLNPSCWSWAAEDLQGLTSGDGAAEGDSITTCSLWFYWRGTETSSERDEQTEQCETQRTQKETSSLGFSREISSN